MMNSGRCGAVVLLQANQPVLIREEEFHAENAEGSQRTRRRNEMIIVDFLCVLCEPSAFSA